MRALLRAALHDILDSPVVVRLFVVYFAASFGISQVVPFIPILLQQLYHSPPARLPSVIGATLTGAGIAMAITTPLWGRLGDLVGRWRVLPICIGAVAIGIACEGFAASLAPLQAAIVGVGLFQGGIGTTVIALLALRAPEGRRASILNFSLMPTQLSWLFGPIAGAALARVALRLPFAASALTLVVATTLAVLAGLLARRIPHEQPAIDTL